MKFSSLRMIKELTFVFVLLLAVYGYNFNISNIQVFNSSSNNAYFGYTLLLQKGNPSLIVVGAPKDYQYGVNAGSMYHCDIEKNVCRKLKIYTKNSRGSDLYDFEGAMLGLSLAGGSESGNNIYACAPRVIRHYDKRNNFMNGLCYQFSETNGSRNVFILKAFERRPQIMQFDRVPHYGGAFAECGIDVAYSESVEQILIGSPGVVDWAGAVVRWDLRNRESDVLPSRNRTVRGNPYFGYSVGFGNSNRDSINYWYAVGEPRGNGLKGRALLFQYSPSAKNKISISAELFGDKVGSYFGASILAVDVNNDDNDDVFVGAPMYSTRSFDEGCVYYYQSVSRGQFESKIVMSGPEKPGARFGTSIASLGDIDLDGYNDVAISAPYEDEHGAIYIFSGRSYGIKLGYTQRITPKDFNVYDAAKTMGFGISISRGVDIDYNGHNDIAVGAYKSDQVFLIKTFAMVDFKVDIRSAYEPLLINITHFELNWCIVFEPRNKKLFDLEVEVRILLDERSLNNTFVKNLVLKSSISHCETMKVHLKNTHFDFTPFEVKLIYVRRNATVERQDPEVVHSIPFAEICGDDNICQTDLVITALVENYLPLLIGSDSRLILNLSILNLGEPAFKPVLRMQGPRNVNLINIRGCDVGQWMKGFASCPLGEKILNEVDQIFQLDIRKLNPSLQLLEINISVMSLGIEKTPENNNLTLVIPVLWKADPEISGKSIPDALNLLNEEGDYKKNLNVKHNFYIKNLGPSPMNTTLEILVPHCIQCYLTPFQVIEIEALLNDNYLMCRYKDTEILGENDLFSSDDDLFVISCSKRGTNCSRFFCDSAYLPRGDIIKLELRIELKMDKIVETFGDTLVKKDIQFNTTVRMIYHSSQFQTEIGTLLYGPSNLKMQPLWLYVISIALGIILFIILTLILHKIGFFERSYRKKMIKLQEESTTVKDSTEDEPDRDTEEDCP